MIAIKRTDVMINDDWASPMLPFESKSTMLLLAKSTTKNNVESNVSRMIIFLLWIIFIFPPWTWLLITNKSNNRYWITIILLANVYLFVIILSFQMMKNNALIYNILLYLSNKKVSKSYFIVMFSMLNE